MENDRHISTRSTLKSIFTLLLLVVSSLQLYGATYFVAKHGNDNDDGSFSRPWLTIQKAAKTLVAGDTVFVREGVYAERLIPQKSGAPGKYICYFTYPGDTVTIDGATVTLPNELAGLIDIRNQRYIEVSGFRVFNAGPDENNAGIFIDSSSFIAIKRNHTFNTVSSGIGLWNSRQCWIDSNEVELACNDGEQESVSIVTCDSFVVSHNVVHRGGPGTNGGEGIDVKWGSTNGKIFGNSVFDLNRVGIYADAWTKYSHNIEIFQNIVYRCEEGIDVASEAGGLIENVFIYNNLIFDNTYNGTTIGYWGIPAPNRPINKVFIMNNTYYGNGRTGGWGGAILLENPDATNIVIRNNICSKNFFYQIATENGVTKANFTADHNLIYEFQKYEGEIFGSNSVVSDPLFINPSMGDFRISPSSPAIDKGSPLGAPANDYDGSKRPVGKGFDIGAYEFQGIPNAVRSHKEDVDFVLEQNYPNPFVQSTTIRYRLFVSGYVRLEVFNLFGRKIATLVDEVKELGKHETPFEASALAAGIYVYRLSSLDHSRMMIAVASK